MKKFTIRIKVSPERSWVAAGMWRVDNKGQWFWIGYWPCAGGTGETRLFAEQDVRGMQMLPSYERAKQYYEAVLLPSLISQGIPVVGLLIEQEEIK